MHALRRATLAAPRQSPLRCAAPRSSIWQPVARCFSSSKLASAEQPQEGNGKADEAKQVSSESADLTPTEQARMNKAIGDSLSDFKKTTYKKPAPAAQTSTNTTNTNQMSTNTTKPPAQKEKPAAHSKQHDLGNELMSQARKTPGYAMKIERVDWNTEYYGASAFPVSEKQYSQLTEPLQSDDVEVKPDGVIYLPEIKYRRKLNQVFGPMGWSLIPRGDPVVGQNIVTREYVLVADNRFVSQAQGENNYFNADQLPSAVEGCKSNALMRCCKDLGIASELWDPIFVRNFRKKNMVETWVEHAVTKKKRTLWFKRNAVEYVYPWKKAGSGATGGSNAA